VKSCDYKLEHDIELCLEHACEYEHESKIFNYRNNIHIRKMKEFELCREREMGKQCQ